MAFLLTKSEASFGVGGRKSSFHDVSSIILSEVSVTFLEVRSVVQKVSSNTKWYCELMYFLEICLKPSVQIMCGVCNDQDC